MYYMKKKLFSNCCHILKTKNHIETKQNAFFVKVDTLSCN